MSESESGDQDTWPQYPQAIPLALQALSAFCQHQRWYPAKDCKVERVTLDSLIALADGRSQAAFALWQVTPAAHSPLLMFIPLAIVEPAELAGDSPAGIGELATGQRLVDAVASDDFIRGVVQLMLQGSSRVQSSALNAGHTVQIAALREIPATLWRIERNRVEQSNSSVRVAERSILKIIRKVAPGLHPELEMARFLTEQAHFRATPALLGWLNFGDKTVAILQEYIANEGDGWSWVRAKVSSGAAGSRAAEAWLSTLGRRTAELHLALCTQVADDAFSAQPTDHEDWQRWGQQLRTQKQQAVDALKAAAAMLDADTRCLAEELHRGMPAFDRWLAAFIIAPPQWLKSRHHGDYHLGQVLVSADDAIILDFEGEPMRSLDERRAKHVALRDVAGMLRSIKYVSATLQTELPATTPAAQRLKEKARLLRWAADASRGFSDGYFNELKQGASKPLDEVAADRLLQFFLIEKGFYEVLYELANRPTWVALPLKSLVAQLEQTIGE